MARASLRVERLLAMARIAFYLAILVRMVLTESFSPGFVMSGGALMSGILLSLYILFAVKRPPRGHLLWSVSVALDLFTAYAALSTNILWPSATFRGSLWMPETAGVTIATMVAGLRLSIGTALVGGMASLLGLATLVSLEAARGFKPDGRALSIYVVFICASTLVALIVAVFTRRLVLAGAESAVRAGHAKRGLDAVLANCHDARSLLTSVRLSADVLASKPQDAGAHQLALHLSEDVEHVAALVREVNLRAVGELSRLQPAAKTDLLPTLQRVLGQCHARYPTLDIATRLGEGVQVLVCGGATALKRVLVNVLNNACEGDGVQRPTTVMVRVQLQTSSAEVIIDDDGPGLPAEGLIGISSKRNGLGVGLSIVRAVCEGSEGALRLEPRVGGGTSAIITLPLAEPSRHRRRRAKAVKDTPSRSTRHDKGPPLPSVTVEGGA